MTDPRARLVIAYAPILLLAGAALLLMIPATRGAALWLLAEDHLVEDLTFVTFVAAAAVAARLAWTQRVGFESWVCGAYVVLSLACFAIAMEEMSWGQRRFGFATPEWLRQINRQGEVTLHNVGALQGRSEWMRLGAGLLGLAAVAVRRFPALDRIAAPAVLLPWFLVITAHALVDVFNDLVPIERRFDFLMQRTSEMIELEIGLAAFLYVWLNGQRLRNASQSRLPEATR